MLDVSVLQIKLIKELPSLLHEQPNEPAPETEPVVAYQRDKTVEEAVPQQTERPESTGDSEFVSDEYNQEDFEDGKHQ